MLYTITLTLKSYSNNRLELIDNWCTENVGAPFTDWQRSLIGYDTDGYDRYQMVWQFKNEHDASMFALKWS